jgi:hypothetical protein
MKMKNGKPMTLLVDETESTISNCSAAEIKRKCNEFFRKRGLVHEYNSKFGNHLGFQKTALPTTKQ